MILVLEFYGATAWLMRPQPTALSRFRKATVGFEPPNFGFVDQSPNLRLKGMKSFLKFLYLELFLAY